MFNSVQWGIATIPDTTNDLYVSLNFNVAENKSFVMIEVTNEDGESSYITKAGDYLIAPELTTVVSGQYTQLRLRRYYLTLSGISMKVKWTVIELLEGSVETGVTTMSSIVMEPIISNYVNGKTFSLAYPYSSDFLWTLEGWNDQVIAHKVYNNGTNDVVRLEMLSGSYIDSVYWQTIYIPAATVQLEEFSCGSVQTLDHTNSEAVNMDNTIVIGSHLQNITHNSNQIKGYYLFSSTQIRTYSWAAAEADFYIYVISHPAINVKHRGSILWGVVAGGSFALSQSVDQYKSFSLLNHQSQHWGLMSSDNYYFGAIGVRSELITLYEGEYTQMQLNRGSTHGSDMRTYQEAIELTLGAFGPYLFKNFPAGFAKGQHVGFA